MNPLNYASLEASKKLVEARIVLKTDIQWANVIGFDGSEDWELNASWGEYPAPTMADVWRELPDDIDGHELGMGKEDGESYVFYKSLKDFPYNTNPTDALTDLLIWARKEAKP